MAKNRYLFMPDFQPGDQDPALPRMIEAQNQNEAEQDAYRNLKPGHSGKLYKELGPISRPTEKARA